MLYVKLILLLKRGKRGQKVFLNTGYFCVILFQLIHSTIANIDMRWCPILWPCSKIGVFSGLVNVDIAGKY